MCAGVLERLRAAAFTEGSPLLGPVHVLDLDKAGFIKAHVDSVKVCCCSVCVQLFTAVAGYSVITVCLFPTSFVEAPSLV